MAEPHLGLSRTLSGLRRTLHVKGSNFGENTVKGSIFLAREGRGDEGFEFLRVDSSFREKGSSICEKAMKGSSFFAGGRRRRRVRISPAEKINRKTGAKKNLTSIPTFMSKNLIVRRWRPGTFLLDLGIFKVGLIS